MNKDKRKVFDKDRAPTWLYEGETYGLWYSDLANAEQIEPYKAFPFIDWGQPASNVKWVKEFHKFNIRSIAYVSFYFFLSVSFDQTFLLKRKVWLQSPEYPASGR